MRTYLDTAYRRFLRGKYHKIGFTTFRMYIDAVGNSFVSVACFYCGDMANTEDHTLPLIALQSLLSTNAQPSKDKFIVVPACWQCNSILGDRVFPTLGMRKTFVKHALRKRFKKILRLPIWHEDELRELGPTLRSAVVQGIALQRKIKERLAW